MASSVPPTSTPESGPAPVGDAQRLTTGVLGTVVLVGGASWCAVLAAGGHDGPLFGYRHALLLAAVFVVMAGYEIGVVRVYRRNFDFASPRPWTPDARRRVAARSGALAGHILLAVVAYVVLTHYGLDLAGRSLFRFQDSWYAPWFRLFFPLCAAVAVLGPAYAWLSERYGRWSPDTDDLLEAAGGYGALLRLRRPGPGFWAAQRGLLVKLYFLPVMTVFLVGNASNFEYAVRGALLHQGSTLDMVGLGLLWDVAFHGMYLVDVALAVLGYIVALRLFDTHVRSADPTLSGWVVALACYPPFTQLMDLYLGYRGGEHSWSGTLAGSPGTLLLVGGAALLLIGVYTMATVAFGLRFSNMTHRGIVSRGPYAWVRHPAYAAKVLSWWLLSAPFLRGVGDTVRLGLWSAVYVGRALTEERHLRTDPAYRAYQARVRWRFVPGVW